MTLSYLGSEEVCVRHAERLKWASETLKPLFPLDEEKIEHISAIDLAVMDQFVVRFSKLQDAMGAKLFPAVLELTKEPGELRTFIDKLNRLEKIGAIESAAHWLILREIRNQFAHDYPTDREMQAVMLNKAFSITASLLETLARVRIFVKPYLDGTLEGVDLDGTSDNTDA